MRLTNFEISSSIELQSGGLFWDLHNFADFSGLELIPSENAAVMRWRVSASTPNPWGSVENKFSGVELRFEKLMFLNVGPRDEEMPMSEDTCMSRVLRVDPNIVHEQPYMRQVQDLRDSFRLAFSFQSARVIEIESDIVKLVPIA
jgi:hypothetical protein